MHLEKSCKSIFQIGTYLFERFYQVNTCKNTIVHHLKKVCLGAKYLFTIQYTFLSNYLRNSKSFKDSDDIWRQCIAYVLHYYFASIWWLTEPYLQNVIKIISELLPFNLRNIGVLLFHPYEFSPSGMTQFSVLFIDHQYSGGVDWYYTNFALAQSMVQQ